MVNLYLKSYIFCLLFILYLHVSPEDGSNTDPIRIRIHNTDWYLTHPHCDLFLFTRWLVSLYAFDFCSFHTLTPFSSYLTRLSSYHDSLLFIPNSSLFIPWLFLFFPWYLFNESLYLDTSCNLTFPVLGWHDFYLGTVCPTMSEHTFYIWHIR